MTLPAVLADPALDQTAVGVLVGIALLALVVAAGLVVVAARQAKTIRGLRDDLARSNRRGYELAEANARLRQWLGPPPPTRPRMPRPGPPPEPTIDLRQTHVLPGQANHGGAT